MRRLIVPERWAVERGHEVMASRTQLPLKLAWALSIHKSQVCSTAKSAVTGREPDGMMYFSTGNDAVASSRELEQRFRLWTGLRGA